MADPEVTQHKNQLRSVYIAIRKELSFLTFTEVRLHILLGDEAHFANWYCALHYGTYSIPLLRHAIDDKTAKLMCNNLPFNVLELTAAVRPRVRCKSHINQWLQHTNNATEM
jgi:hypothetical protein